MSQPDEVTPVHARDGDTLRVTVDSFRVAPKGGTFVARHVDPSGFAWDGRMEFGAPPSAYEIVERGPRWPSYAALLTRVEAAEGVVAAATAWRDSRSPNVSDRAHDLFDALDKYAARLALRASGTREGGA